MSISVYEKKSDYVQKLNGILGVSEYFSAIDYARDFIHNDEYVRIRTVIGETFYINVTGNSESAILMEVARFINGVAPIGFVTSRDAKWRAAKLFAKGA